MTNTRQKDRKSCAIYTRVSLDATGQELAVSRQEEECRELAKKLGYEVAAVFSDNSISATSGKRRPGFEQLISARPSAVVVWHTDRLARKGADLERVIELDIPVHAVAAGTVELDTPAGRAVARTLAAWSTYETEQMKERQKAANRQKAASGKPKVTVRPFGYVDTELSAIDPVEGPLVAQAYADLLEGASQSSIVKKWNDAGVVTTHGKAWRQSSLRQLLMNPRNAGLLMYKNAIVGAGRWEPIVDEQTYRAAVARMSRQPGTPKPGGVAKHLLTGAAECGVCGGRIGSGVSVRGQKQYVCRSKRCVGRDMRDVDEYVTAVVLGRLTGPDAQTFIGQAAKSPEWASAMADAHSARERLEELGEMFAEGSIPRATFDAGIARAKERLTEAEQSMVAASPGSLAIATASDPVAAWDAASNVARRELIRALMTITIGRTQRGARDFDPDAIRIEWRV